MSAAGFIEYTFNISKPNKDWELIPCYTITVNARPNDRQTALRWVHKWVNHNTPDTASAYAYELVNAELPCYEDNAIAHVEFVGVVTRRQPEEK